MPRVIVKCRYYRHEKAHRDIGGLLEYIAKREGVDKLEDVWKSAPVTSGQQKMIDTILKSAPTAKALVEYWEYGKNPTRGYASEFISRAIEENSELLGSKTYLDYIATRPRAEKIEGAHGLFTDDGVPVNLSDEANKLREHDGIVFTVIVSLKRADAERLGFNSAERWRSFLRAQKDEIAKQHGIPLDKLKWYGAFHNESHHPHIHMVLYSTDEHREGYISKHGIDNLRRTFGTEIFRDELSEIYDEQTARRNTLTAEAREEFEEIFMQMQTGVYADKSVIDKISELAEKLNSVKGKKVYGYLPPKLKELVNTIIDELAEDERLKRLYDLWYESRCAVYKTYTDTLPSKKPLSQEETFKPIRNALISHAVKLGETFAETDRQSDTPKKDGAENSRHNTSANISPHTPTMKSNAGTAGVKFGYAMTTATRLARDASNIFRERFNENANDAGLEVDSRLRREIEAKKKGQNISM